MPGEKQSELPDRSGCGRMEEAMLRGILNATQESIWLFDADGRIQLANETALRRLGKSLAEITGHHPGEFMPPALAQFRHAYIQEVLRSKRPVEFEDERAGMAFQHSLYPVMDDSGNATCVVCYSRDITERRRTEKTLRQWADAFEHCAHGIAMGVPGANEILVCNPAFARLFGRPVNEICGAKILSLYAPEDQEHVRDKIAEADRVGRSEYEARMVRADGSRFLVQMDVASVSGADGTPIYRIATVQDVTERKRLEVALQDAASRREALFEQTPIGLLVYDPANRRILDFNAVAHQQLGYSREEFAALDLMQIEASETAAEAAAHVDRVFRAGRDEFVTRHRTKSGELRDVRVIVKRVDLVQGVVFKCIWEDITERKRAEEKLLLERQRLFDVLETLPTMICLLTPDYHVAFANRSFRQKFGEAHGRRCFEYCFGRAEPCDFCEAYSVLKTGQPRHWEVTTPDGSLIEVHDYPFADVNGAPMILEMNVDITERRRLETERAEMLARLEKIQEEERQRVSRELHDQTAQRLVALAVELKNLQNNLAAGRPQGERVQSLRQAVDDLQQQVHQIAWDLRAGELTLGHLESALRDYVEEWSERAQVAVDWEYRGLAGQPLPEVVEITLYRIAQEALTNVQRHARARRVSVLLERDEAMARLTVEDNGRGFDADAVLKTPEAARRLGLLGMKERVTLAGGTLLIESSPEAGTTVLVRIPISINGKIA